MLPRQSRLFLDYTSSHEPLSPFFVSTPWSQSWANSVPAQDAAHRSAIADQLLEQNRLWNADPATLGAKTLANIERLRQGAGAVVSGQQVALFGGPLFTFLKAATIIRRAQTANAVPIFWLATEDHDLAEADHVILPSRHALHTLRLHPEEPSASKPVGPLHLGPSIVPLLERAAELIGGTPEFDLLTASYTPGATFASSFARLIAATFANYGLVVIDASTRAFHALGAPVLRHAIEHAADLESALHERDKLLAERGYHSQVLVAPGSSLLFLIDETTGARLPLRRKNGGWLAGKSAYSTADLLAILDATPERLSPNALLRPVYQDFLLPTMAAIGGPAEIAYFAQSQVLYQAILGRTTPVLPRLSATLIEPSIAKVLDQHELSLSLGRSARVSASKMRYQMNRLRRLAANYQLQREASIRRHVDTLSFNLFPDRHPQERTIGGLAYLARYGAPLLATLVEQATQDCPGHKAMYL